MDRDQVIYLDTHVLLRLYLGEVRSLGVAARKAIEEHELVASPAKESWVRDPFDRMIVAHARASGAPLVTKDERIHRHDSRAIW